jgi:hypothetical protein
MKQRYPSQLPFCCEEDERLQPKRSGRRTQHVQYCGSPGCRAKIGETIGDDQVANLKIRMCTGGGSGGGYRGYGCKGSTDQRVGLPGRLPGCCDTDSSVGGKLVEEMGGRPGQGCALVCGCISTHHVIARSLSSAACAPKSST